MADSVVNDSKRARKPEPQCAPAYGQGVFGSLDAAADHRIDIDFELR